MRVVFLLLALGFVVCQPYDYPPTFYGCGGLPIFVGNNDTDLTLYANTDLGFYFCDQSDYWCTGLNCYPYYLNLIYTITPPPGATVTISACNNYNNQTNMVYFGLYEGSDCMNIYNTQCSTTDSNCYYPSSKLNWVAQSKLYYITVISEYPELIEFRVETTGGNTPSSCENAQVIEGPYFPVPITLNGVVGNGGMSQFCGNSVYGIPDWYLLKTTPNIDLQISSCNTNDFPVVMGILSGDCADGECIDFFGTTCEFGFLPTNSSYYLFVASDYYNGGEYTITIYEDAPISAGCIDAFPHDLAPGNKFSTQGSTSTAIYAFNLTICGDEDGFALWYDITFMASGSVQCSTCSGANFETVIYVYSGSCNNLQCVTDENTECGTGSSVFFEVEESDSYYVVVGGADGQNGFFDLVCQYLDN